MCALVAFLATNNYWSGVLPLWARFLAAVAFGVCQAMPLLHVMHDSSHTAFGNTQVCGLYLAAFFDLVPAGCDCGSLLVSSVRL